jgi:hypothetical protein
MPRRASLPPKMNPGDVTMDIALKLLELPRILETIQKLANRSLQMLDDLVPMLDEDEILDQSKNHMMPMELHLNKHWYY